MARSLEKLHEDVLWGGDGTTMSHCSEKPSPHVPSPGVETEDRKGPWFQEVEVTSSGCADLNSS